MNDDDAWAAPPVDLQATSHAVDVWRVPLDASDAEVESAAARLPDDERAAAARFRVATRRREYVMSRTALRCILGRLVGADASSLGFAYGAFGKPELAAPWCDRQVSFNVSHSHGMALVAVTVGRAIGVDIEFVRPRVSYQALARRYFSAREVETLLSLPASERLRAFFTCWTRKEAVIKAVGQGVSLGLNRFSVSLSPSEPPAVLATDWDPADAARWSIVPIDPGDGYVAAIAVRGHDMAVRPWQMA